MNTKTILLVIAVVAIGATGYYLLNNRSDMSSSGEVTGDMATTQEQAEGSVDEMGTSAEEGMFSGSFFDLASRSGDWECTFSATSDTEAGTVETSGVVYTSEGNVRADFTSEVPSYGTMDSHMIADADSVYTWSAQAPQGVKVPREQAETESDGEALSAGSAADMHYSYDYDCSKTTVDQALFVPPTEVSFMEI